MSKSSSSGLTPENPKRLDFDEIKRTTDLVAVIEAHGVALEKEGRDYVGLCPFHDDQKPTEHLDWVTSGSRFTRQRFGAVLDEITKFALREA